MMNKIEVKKLNKFFEKEFKQQSKIAIFQNENGTFDLFDRFIIVKEQNNFIVKVKNTYQDKSFFSLKYAVTYCIFCQKTLFAASNRLQFLDKMIESINAEIEIHKNLIKKSKDIDTKDVYLSKLTENLYRKKNFIKEADDYIMQGKSYQYKDFNNN